MILLVDAGNSRIKWRVQSGGRVVSSGDLATLTPGLITKAWQGVKASAACICSVAGEEVNDALRLGLDLVLPQLAPRPRFLASPAEGHGIVNLYHPPQSLGPDRFAALVAARRRHARDWVVVGVGTALTVDMLSEDGCFMGGAIAPGPSLMHSTLMRGTAGIRTSMPSVVHGWPRDTQSAVSQGIAWGLWGVVEGMARLFFNEVGRPPGVLLSGGARHILRPLLPDDVVEVEEIVLEGLAWIARDLGYDA